MKDLKARFDILIWALVYGGLFALGPGIALQRMGEDLGWIAIVGGAVATATGIVLLWVRSRLPDSSAP